MHPVVNFEVLLLLDLAAVIAAGLTALRLLSGQVQLEHRAPVLLSLTAGVVAAILTTALIQRLAP
jgi:hypothetical protein